jgi:hypothetical protein
MDPIQIVVYSFVTLAILVGVFFLFGRRGPSSEDPKLQGLLASAAMAKRSGDHQQAAMLYERAISELESAHKVDEALLCTALVGAAESLERTGGRKEASQLISRVVSIWETALNAGRVDFMTDVDYLCMDGNFGSSTADVARFYETVLAFREQRLPPNSPEFINTIVIYAKLNRTLGEKEIAEQLEQHAEKLRHGGSSVVETPDNSAADQSTT